MHGAFEVFGLVDDDEVEVTVKDLRAHGVDADDIEVREPSPGRYWVADERGLEDATHAGHGALAGLAIGIFVGLLAAASIPGLEAAGESRFALAVMFCGGLGAFIGAMTGMAAFEVLDDDPMPEVELAPGQGRRMVLVNSTWKARVAHKIMANHGSMFLEDVVPH